MRGTIGLAAVSGFIFVAAGAWTAHGAQSGLDARALAWLHTGIEYQAWHSLALLGAGILQLMRPSRWLDAAIIAFALGILLFSGSLYALALTGAYGFAMVTPVGGTAFLAGWLLLVVYTLAQPRPR